MSDDLFITDDFLLSQYREIDSIYDWKIKIRELLQNIKSRQKIAYLLSDKLKSFRSTVLIAGTYIIEPLIREFIQSSRIKYREINKSAIFSLEDNNDNFIDSSIILVYDHIVSLDDIIESIRSFEARKIVVEGIIAISCNIELRNAVSLRALGYQFQFMVQGLGKITKSSNEFQEPVDKVIWDSMSLEDGLNPTVAVRRLAEHYFRTGKILQPPTSFDQPYETKGGVWLSVRRKSDSALLGRGGFWKFDQDGSSPNDIVVAAIITLSADKGSIRQQWGLGKIGLTLVKNLEPITPQEMNYSRYGIVIKSCTDEKIGYALPNGQGIASDIQQYRHAFNQARLWPQQEGNLYRFELNKLIEPNENWLPYGKPSYEDKMEIFTSVVPDSLFYYARQAIEDINTHSTTSLSIHDNLIPFAIDAIAVSLYSQGAVGCATSWKGSLGMRIREAAQAAYQDHRLVGKVNSILDIDAVVITVLYNAMHLKEVSKSYFARTIQQGINAFSVQQGRRFGVFLDTVIPHYSWSAPQALDQLMSKARIDNQPVTWTSYQSIGWLQKNNKVSRLVYGFPSRTSEEISSTDYLNDVDALATYIYTEQDKGALPRWRSFPVTGHRQSLGFLSHALHALYGLGRAGILLKRSEWKMAASNGINYCLKHFNPKVQAIAVDGWQSGWVANVLLLLAISRGITAPLEIDLTEDLAQLVKQSFRPDGRIAPPKSLGPSQEDHDYLPGTTIFTLATYALQGSIDISDLPWIQTFDWYRKRFALVHPWGMVFWHPQAWIYMYRLTQRQEYIDFAYEIVDWALDYQLNHNGAFLTDVCLVGPSFHTACIAEAVGAAWSIAEDLGDMERARRYEIAWKKALQFMRRLIITPKDTFCTRIPLAVGGVRLHQSSSEVRIDYVSHTILAILENQKLTDK